LLRCAEWAVLALVVYGAVMAALGRRAPMPYITGAVDALFADEAGSLKEEAKKS
jgi:hypothetical protein